MEIGDWKFEITHEQLMAGLVALGVAVAVFIALLWLRRWIRAVHTRMAATERIEFLELPLGVLAHTSMLFFLVLSVFIGFSALQLTADARKVLNSLITIALFWQAGIWAVAAVNVWLNRKRAASRAANLAAISSLGIISFIAQALIWVVVLLLTLENLGVRVTALVAGLGVGGVAVALAVQNVLGDILASLSISFDRPFVLGDFLVMGDVMGSVEYIGVKTTRLRALSGEQIILSNGDLLKSRIHNYGRMAERRVQFNFWVAYDTAAEVLEALPGKVRAMVEAQQPIRFDRCHFSKYTQTALEFEVVYIVLSADYNKYMDIQQAINLAIFRELVGLKVQFAHPGTTLYLPKDSPLTALAQSAAERLREPERGVSQEKPHSYEERRANPDNGQGLPAAN